jgi:hypothetical protein
LITVSISRGFSFVDSAWRGVKSQLLLRPSSWLEATSLVVSAQAAGAAPRTPSALKHIRAATLPEALGA